MSTLYSAWHCSPAAIAGAAQLYNYACTNVRRASVLEIGCGRGENLLRQATAYPESTCVGVDIDPERIAAGVASMGEQQLANAHLYCMGLADLLSVEVGKFDYIVIPSLYSMLDNDSRDALLAWCHSQLGENGVIAVKWNVLPGAYANPILQQAIAWHSQQAQTEQAWLGSARAMLSFMQMSELDDMLKEQVEQALKLSDAELLVHYLEEKNDASFLNEFIVKVNACELHVLGDAVPQYEMADHYSGQIAVLQDAIAPGKERAQTQQYLDFAVQRRQRFSLLIAQDCAQKVSDSPDTERLANMHWAANYASTDDSNRRINRYGIELDTSSPLARRILDWLRAAWPRSLSTEQIIRNSLQPEKPQQHEETILEALRALYLARPASLYVSAFPSPYNTGRGEKMQLICAYSEQEVEGGAWCVRTNWWGETLAFRRAEYELFERGMHIENDVDAYLTIELAGKGLVSGNALCWTRLWQSVFSCGNYRLLESHLRSYLLAISPETDGGLLTASAERTILMAKLKETVNVKKARRAEVLLLAGYTTQAKESIVELLADNPEDATFMLLAIDSCLKCADYDTALTLVCKRLALDGNYLMVLGKLANVLADKEVTSATLKLVYQYLLKRDAGNSLYWALLSICYTNQDRTTEERCLATSLELDAENSTSLLRLAGLQSHSGRLEEAKELCHRALALPLPELTRLRTMAAWLFILSHDAVIPAQAKFRQHIKFGALASRWAKGITLPKAEVKRAAERQKIRIGFVSGDLNSHPVHLFFYPIWQAIDRDRYELYAYATGKVDAITERYKTSATVYRYVASISEHELAAQIIEDGIDVLIDLSGFTNGNRLLTFALKPAPVQMSWIGFVGTTGLKEMDYYITYAGLAAPGELDEIFTEKVVSLPCAKIFEYSLNAPDLAAAPALKNGYLTLGNFNRPQKLTPAILDCWASIMTVLPTARLLFGFMADEKMIGYYASQMAHRGVARERLDFCVKLELNGYLAMHNEVDILLDSHPYSAGTTAQYALWMGVPVVTATEGSAVSRTSASTMRTFGLDEFVVANLDEYAQKVIELNDRYDHLNTIRLSMRERIAQREKSHSHNAWYFEKMIDTVWQRHLKGEQPESLFIEDEHRWDEEA